MSCGNPSWLTTRHWLVRYSYWCRKPSGGVGYTSWNNSRNEANPCGSQNCLKVKVDRNGAARTFTEVKKVRPGGGTDANVWATQADEYFRHSTDSPIDPASPCQGSYIIVIGDGSMSNIASAKTKVKNLLNQKKVKTFNYLS